MRDIDVREQSDINYIKDIFTDIANAFNFKVIGPSPIEMLCTLEAKSGTSIANEIYTFKDKADRDVALRFDLTVGLTRFVTSRRDLKMPVKLAAFDGVWRYDEPQAGRYRYFHQWDIEIYDSFNYESDAEIIQFISVFFRKLGLGNILIELSDRQLLEEYIEEYLGISDHYTIDEIFRAIDKVPKKGREIVYRAYKDKIKPSILESVINLSNIKGNIDHVYSNSGIGHLQSWGRLFQLSDSLKSRRVSNVRINLGIVRGLDYYSGVVFEAVDPSVPHIGSLVGGGRYNTLTETFGRKDMGASGAAGGVERIIEVLKKYQVLKAEPKKLVYVAYSSSDSKSRAIDLVSNLRRSGYVTDYDILGRSLRRQLEDASAKEAILTVIVRKGDEDYGQITLRIMQDGTEVKKDISELPRALDEMLSKY